MRKLLRYLRHYKKESILGPLFKMTEAIFELFVPIVMAKIVDIGIYNKDVSYILKMGGILVLLGILGLTCSLTAQYFAAKAAVGFGTELRNDMYKHINQFPGAWHIQRVPHRLPQVPICSLSSACDTCQGHRCV